ncbi:MAG: hypothetical protein JNG88_10415 [Phycisphaerales bacterium]|nr:hypothetical protein [Phycisphaerales bacterium]
MLRKQSGPWLLGILCVVMFDASSARAQTIAPQQDDPNDLSKYMAASAFIEVQEVQCNDPALLSLLFQNAPQNQNHVPLDEELFILYAINHCYTHWPDPTTDGHSFVPQLDTAIHAQDILASRAWALQRTEVAVLADQTRNMLRFYKQFLESNQLIHDAAEADARSDGERAFLGTTIAYAQAVGQKAGLVGTAVAVGLAQVDGAISSRNLSRARANLLNVEREKYEGELRSRERYFEETVKKLTAARVWQQADLDFTSASASRSRDPFLLHDRALLSTLTDRNRAGLAADAAETCVLAAGLVPQAACYDRFRQMFLQTAAELIGVAAAMEWRDSDYRYGGPIALRGTEICKACRAYSPVTERHSWCLAKCLHFAGNFSDALRVAEKLRTNDHFLAYDYACILSKNRKYAEALRELSRSYSLGATNVAWARRDPDLEGLRAAMPNEFQSLTTPKITFEIEWGFFRNDVHLRNESPFGLTNVEIRPCGQFVVDWEDKSAGDPPFDLLTASLIKPGAIYVWKGAARGRKRDFKLEYSEWTCDQK